MLRAPVKASVAPGPAAVTNRTPYVALVALAALALALPVQPLAGQAPQNISVALIIDNSGSMAATDPTGLRFAAAGQLVDLLEEGDEIAVVLFEDDASALVMLTEVSDSASKEAVKAGLAPVTPGGNTNMRAALEAGLAELDKASSNIRFVIFLTDGELHPPGWEDFSAQQQEAERQAVLELAADFSGRGWGLFPISLADAVEPEFLQGLAAAGGGLYQAAPEAGSVTLAFQEVFAANKLDVFEVLFDDCLSPAEEVPISFPVHPFVSSLSLFVTYTTDLRPAVTVTGPDGGLLNPTSDDPRYDAYLIDSPARGTWTVTVTGEAGGESCASISSTPRSVIDVVWLQPAEAVSLPPDAPLEVAVRLTAVDPESQEERPVEGATVRVTVAAPGGESYDGALAETAPGDYGGALPIGDAEGEFEISLQVETAEGLVALHRFQFSLSRAVAEPTTTAGPTPSPAPTPDDDRGGSSALLVALLAVGVLTLAVGLFGGYARFARPLLSGWLMSNRRLISARPDRAYNLEARHRRVWTRRPLTLGGSKDDIDLGLGRRAARVAPRRGGECYLQAVVNGRVWLDGKPLKKGERRRLQDGSEMIIGGVALTFRRQVGGPRIRN